MEIIQKQLSLSDVMATKHVIGVIGMTCGGCSGRLERVLMEKSGIISAEVSHESGLAIIHATNSVTELEIKNIVKSTGFEIK